jgi:hypothetical protein
LSIDEALALAKMRGLSTRDALARALLVETRGGSEAEAVRAVLEPASVDEKAVQALIDAAQPG